MDAMSAHDTFTALHGDCNRIRHGWRFASSSSDLFLPLFFSLFQVRLTWKEAAIENDANYWINYQIVIDDGCSLLYALNDRLSFGVNASDRIRDDGSSNPIGQQRRRINFPAEYKWFWVQPHQWAAIYVAGCATSLPIVNIGHGLGQTCGKWREKLVEKNNEKQFFLLSLNIFGTMWHACDKQYNR